MGGSRGGTDVLIPHLENQKWLIVFLEILVRTPLEKQLDPSGHIASRGRSVLKPFQDLPD